MKIDKKPIEWNHEPWTIVNIGDEHGSMYYAFNTLTGERKPVRYSYDVAFEDIPVNG